MKISGSVLLGSLLLCLLPSTVMGAAATRGMSLQATIAPESLGLSAKDGSIEAFDLAPSGKRVGVLCATNVTPTTVNRELVLATISPVGVVARLPLGVGIRYIAGYADHVRFSHDGRYLVVQTLSDVDVVDSNTLKLLHHFTAPQEPLNVPVSLLMAKGSNVAAVSFGSGQPFKSSFERTRLATELIDLESGQILGEWQSEDIPQAISPDGALTLISDWIDPPDRGVLKVQVVNARTGTRTSPFASGFGYPTSPSQPLGRAIPAFLTNNEIVLVPDATRDMAGNLSGNTIRIITYPAIKLSTELTPKHFGSTGELAMSGNGEHFAVVSWFLSAYVARHDVAIPRNSTPVMLVYTLGMKSPTAIIPLKALGLSSNTWTDVLRPSLSDDGRSIAVAQNGSIDVFSGEVSNSLPK